MANPEKTAPLGLRTLAYLVDISVVSLVATAVTVLYFLILAALGVIAYFWVGQNRSTVEWIGMLQTPLGMVTFGILILIFLSLQFGILHGYFVYFETRDGQTPGKKMFGIKAISTRGAPMTTSQALWRDLMRYVDGFLIFPGLISVLLSKEGLRLGDHLAGTRVVSVSSEESSFECLYMDNSQYLRLLEQLKPSAASRSEQVAYLEFAYPHLILGKPAREDLTVREAWVRGKVAANSESRDLLLRFYAEFLTRAINQEAS